MRIGKIAVVLVSAGLGLSLLLFACSFKSGAPTGLRSAHPLTGGADAGPPNGPAGIYVYVDLSTAVVAAMNAADAGATPIYDGGPTNPFDIALTNYYFTLLSNPAVSGLFLATQWCLLDNSTAPPTGDASPSPSYQWNYIDDAFIAVHLWNEQFDASQPMQQKGIQLNISPGSHTPGWVFSHIDEAQCGDAAGPAGPTSVCAEVGPDSGVPGAGCGSCTDFADTHTTANVVPVGCGSCDFLFAEKNDAALVDSGIWANASTNAGCGYTTIFYTTEGKPFPAPLPMPWNPTYQADWASFLSDLRNHLQEAGTGSGAAFDLSDFLSIGVAGPTSDSTEMILPNEKNEADGGPLTLPAAGSYTNGFLAIYDAGAVTQGATGDSGALIAWNTLLDNAFPPYTESWNNTDDLCCLDDPPYPCCASGSDTFYASYNNGEFIQAWETAIDTFGTTFKPSTEGSDAGFFPAVTLIVAAEDGLPDFAWPPDAGSFSYPVPSYCILAGFPYHQTGDVDCGAFPWPTNTPPAAFALDCTNDPSFAVGCAAETTVLQYLVDPGNVPKHPKASQTDALKAPNGGPKPSLSPGLGNLGDWSVKWLAENTADGGQGLLARQSVMLGGLQSNGPSILSGQVPDGGTEEATLYVFLAQYFYGSAAGATSYYGFLDAGWNGNDANASGATVSGAPMNYLQVYDQDMLYAVGLFSDAGNDCLPQIMAGNAASCTSAFTPPLITITKPNDAGTFTATAQNLLSNASYQILGPTPPWLDGGTWNGPDGNTLYPDASPLVPTAETVVAP